MSVIFMTLPFESSDAALCEAGDEAQTGAPDLMHGLYTLIFPC
jgi:hypothetical protein